MPANPAQAEVRIQPLPTAVMLRASIGPETQV